MSAPEKHDDERQLTNMDGLPIPEIWEDAGGEHQAPQEPTQPWTLGDWLKLVLVVALTANDPLYREEMIFGAGGVASHPEGGQ